MTLDARKLIPAALISLGIVLVYWQMFQRLVDAWINDGNYSHGFLIMPIAAYFVWERRQALTAAPKQGSAWGLAVFGAGSVLLIAGMLGSELFISRVAFLATIAGVVLFLFGWAVLRILMFPLCFMLLMIPLPVILFNKIALPLQFVASRAGEWAIATAGIPVLREGNVLTLANTQLEVAEACSGIRSLVTLVTLGIVYGYFADSRGWVRTIIVLSTVPVAIISNGARVAGTGILAHWWGPEAAQGFFHEFSGWLMFVFAFSLLLAIQKLIVRLVPRRS